MHDDDDDDQPTREEIRERYGWKEGEREAAHAEAERLRQQIEGERILREAWAAKEAREARVVTKSAPVTRSVAAAAPGVGLTREWQSWIEARIKRESRETEECMAKAIAQSIGKDIVALERSNADLRERLQHAENEIADLFRMTRAQARDAEIAERFKQYDELQERLDRLESGGRPLKVVGG